MAVQNKVSPNNKLQKQSGKIHECNWFGTYCTEGMCSFDMMVTYENSGRMNEVSHIGDKLELRKTSKGTRGARGTLL
jgi:hypothetical protein